VQDVYRSLIRLSTFWRDIRLYYYYYYLVGQPVAEREFHWVRCFYAAAAAGLVVVSFYFCMELELD
jgi:hypothetical protein